MTIKNNSYFFLAFPLVAILGGLIGYDQYNIFNATLIFESWLIFIIINNLSLKINRVLLSSTLFIYIVASFLIADPLSANNLISFIVIYKSFFYLALLLLLKQNSIKADDIRIEFFLKIIFYAFFIKYSTFFLLNTAEGKIPRPGLFTENNFELAFLICLIILKVKLYSTLTRQDYFLIILIFLFSGSKSGLLSLIFTLFFLNLKINKKTIQILASIAIIFYILTNTIMQKHTSIESVDRFNFLLLFVEELKSFSFREFMIGKASITPLPNYVCQKILFSETLLENDGNCYSTTFHVYWLRLIYDHGLLGLISILTLIQIIIQMQSRRIKLAIFTLVIINGLSVSSINGVYMITGIALILLTQQIKIKKHEHHYSSNTNT